MTDDADQSNGGIDGSRAGTHNRRAKTEWGRVTDGSGLGRVRHSLAMTYHFVLAFLWSWVVLAALLLTAARTALGWLPLHVVWAAPSFVWTQVTGWVSNVWEWRTKGTWTDFVPPTVESTVKWVLDVIPQAFGLRGASAYDQVTANIVLIGVSIATSLFTGGVTLAFVGFWTLLGLYAFFFRETPEGDRLHRKAVRTISEPLPVNLGGES